MNQSIDFQCSSCGVWHDELPLDYGAEAPYAVYEIPASERDARIVGNSEFVVVDNRYYFVRGIIEIPILDQEQSFSWGVWVSVSAKSFRRMIEMLDQTDDVQEPPCFGWLSTPLPYSESTLNLKATVRTERAGVRPKIELETSSHPLALEQKQGITMQRVQQIAEVLLHG